MAKTQAKIIVICVLEIVRADLKSPGTEQTNVMRQEIVLKDKFLVLLLSESYKK
jgi:hypothetical protein